jgi:DNA-binding CsgD family transcriptional regulator
VSTIVAQPSDSGNTPFDVSLDVVRATIALVVDGSFRGREDLLQTIHALSLIEEIDDFGPTVLEEIDGLVPSDLASYNEVDPSAGRALVIARPGQPTPTQLDAWERWAHQNPCLGHVIRTGDGSARRISDFLSPAEFHSLELYTDVYRPLQIEHQVAFCLAAPHPLVIGIALNRRRTNFDDEELRLLDILRPHLIQAHGRLQHLNNLRHALESVAGFLREEGQAFHVIDGPVTGPAADLLSAFFGDTRGVLPQSVQAWLEDERTAFITTAHDRLRQPYVLQSRGRRLTIQYVPAGQSRELLWFHEQNAVDDIHVLQRLGLSKREAEVLWLSTQGLSTKEMALKAGISTLTVKKHLEHVYRKLGVSNRTAAVALAFDAMTVT